MLITYFMPLDILEGSKDSLEKKAESEIKPAETEVSQLPEKSILESDQMSEAEQARRGSEGVSLPEAAPVSTGQGLPVDPAYQTYKQIEGILEEDLGEMYNNLTPQEQKSFKIKGEETSRAVFMLIYHKTKVKVKKIIKLIKQWLKLLPGINKFFLEQEAKIKADKIVNLAGKDKKIEF